MYAHRQIYNDIQATIPVPLELQHRKTEVIFVVLDEVVEPQSDELLGEKMARFFRDIPPAVDPSEAFDVPPREHTAAVTFE
jgi:hypothetical protein